MATQMTSDQVLCGEIRLLLFLLNEIKEEVQAKGFSIDYIIEDVDGWLSHVSLLCDICDIPFEEYIDRLIIHWRKGKTRAFKRPHFATEHHASRIKHTRSYRRRTPSRGRSKDAIQTIQ